MTVNFEYPDPSRVLGLSTSHYTGVVDWQRAKANGVKFAIIKAANGLLTNVRYFKENYAGAKAAGIMVGAYTWLYPSSIYSAGTQARNFAAFLKDYPLDLPPIVDFEKTYPSNPDAGDLYGFVIPFEAAYGKKPMIYTGVYYWRDFGSTAPMWANYPLWQAQYNHGFFDVIRPWNGYDFFQWTQTGKGTDYGVPTDGEIACELNYWRGSLEELQAWCNVEPPMPEPPAPPPPAPSIPAIQTMRFGIIRHRADWDKLWPRVRYYPEVVPLQDKAAGIGKGAQIPIPDAWWRYIRATNNDNGYKYARSIGMMWINTPYSEGDVPKCEAINNSHNFIAWNEETDTHVHMLAFPFDEDPFVNFDPLKMNWRNYPYLFFKAICSNLTGGHINPASGYDVFLPNLKRTDRWLAKSRIEIFPKLPKEVIVNVSALNVRESYSKTAAIVGVYSKGKAVTLYQYRLVGASVWGRTVDGWICLLLSDAPGQRAFYTTWILKTGGVIPPAG